MSAPLWIHELASRFWQMAGGEPSTFPRDLRFPIARAFPLTPVLLANLRVQSIDRWLQMVRVPCTVDTADRPLRACLVAYAGSGAVFLDREDPDAERRFSLAHELAHFLHDYWEPRRRAEEMFGPAALEIFDGKRSPRTEERAHALLSGVPTGFTVHLMERAADGSIQSGEVSTAESDADRLACHLLAPEDALLLDLAAVDPDDRRHRAEMLLIGRYGLPRTAANRYAAWLLPRQESRSFLRVLGVTP